MTQEYFPLLRQFSLAPQSHLNHSPITPPATAYKPAAVLLPIIPHEKGDQILLIQRAFHLKHHPGQMAFPGGRWEKTDIDLMATALRETQEEIGLTLSRHDIFGQLPSLKTVSGYCVTPFLAKIETPKHLQLDQNEVHDSFYASLSDLLDPQNHHQTQVWRKGKMKTIYSIPCQGKNVWGATAQMLVTLSKQIWPLTPDSHTTKTCD